MNEEITKLWKLYEKGLNYQNTLNMKTKCNDCVDFLEGRQWPEATDRTKNLPRPVINIIELIFQNKKSNVLSSSIKMVYKPTELFENGIDTAQKGADIFTKFAEYTRKDLKQSDLDDKAIGDGLTKGTYIYHYFWDNEKYGKTSKYLGGLNGEILDVLNVFFANPNEKDEQKQKWIMISSRDSVGAIKNLAKKNKIKQELIEQIVADDKEKNYDLEEQDNEDFATVLTRYFRINGEVYFEKATKSVLIQPATKLTPTTANIKLNFDNEIEEDESDTDVDVPNAGYTMDLYPIVVGQWQEKENSIFGMGLVEKLIANQKAINFNYAMMLLAIQNIGFPKLKVKPTALAGKSITNVPGEVITDYSVDGQGISYLNPPQFSSAPMQVSDGIISNTRVCNGATEIVSGEVLGANMSGSAIAALQTQAKVPIEVIQKKFWRVHEKIAKIWEQFFKSYYNDNRSFIYQDDEGQNKQESFNGAEYQSTDFATTIEVGAGTMYSEVASVTVLDNMHTKGDITTDEYIELYPDNLMPFKSNLKRMRQTKRLPDNISQMIMQNPQIYQSVMNVIQQAQTPATQQAPIQQ